MAGDHSAVVVLAEDEAVLLGLYRAALESAGFHVLAAADGIEAVALAKAHPDPIDLLVSDVRMPRLGGVELAAALRALYPAVRVVFLSGSHGATDDLGGDALLTKPFAVADLVAKARELLGKAP